VGAPPPTRLRVAGRWTYLYRAIGSAGNTIDFLLSPKRDLTAAEAFLQLAILQAGARRPRVINVDGHPAYPGVIEQLKQSGLYRKQGKTASAEREMEEYRKLQNPSRRLRGIGPQLPMSMSTLFEQYPRAGSSLREEARRG
jgi:transposase-like protein